MPPVSWPLSTYSQSTSLWIHSSTPCFLSLHVRIYRRQHQKLCWTAGRQRLLSSHLSSQSFCHRRLPDWLSMISLWWNHVVCPWSTYCPPHAHRWPLGWGLSWDGGEADSPTVSWVLLFPLFENWSDVGLLSVLRHRSCPPRPLKDDASNIHQFPQCSRVPPIGAHGS